MNVIYGKRNIKTSKTNTKTTKVDSLDLTKEYEEELEATLETQKVEIEKLENTNIGLSVEIDRLKEELKKQKSQYEAKIHQLNDDMGKYKDKAMKFQKELTNLEIENETQAKQNRIKEEIIKELQHKSTKLNETLTIIKMETDELKNMGQEELTRVKYQLKETEEELIVLKQKRNSLVKEEMLDMSKRLSLQVHHSTIFTQAKSIKNLTHIIENPDEVLMTQSSIHDYALSYRLVSANVSNDDLRRTHTSKPLEVKDKRLLDRRFSYTKNFTHHDKELEQKLQQFLNRNKDSPVKSTAQTQVTNKTDRKNKSEWFINVINSLDKKLKDIKTSMHKKN